MGIVAGVEATISLRARVRARARERELAGALRSVLAASGSRLAAAALVAAIASLSLLVVDLPAARSAAVGAAAAILLGTFGALLALPSVLLLSEVGWTEDLSWRWPGGYAPAPLARVGDGLFSLGHRASRVVRRMLRGRAIPLVGIVLALGALVVVAAPAIEAEPVALSSAELPSGGEASGAYQLAKHQFGGAPGAGLGASFSPPADDGLMSALAVAGAVALALAALGSLALVRKPLVALVAALTSVLPAVAAAGVLELAYGARHNSRMRWRSSAPSRFSSRSQRRGAPAPRPCFAGEGNPAGLPGKRAARERWQGRRSAPRRPRLSQGWSSRERSRQPHCPQPANSASRSRRGLRSTSRSSAA